MAILKIQIICVNCQAHWYKMRSLQVVSLFFFVIVIKPNSPTTTWKKSSMWYSSTNSLINMELFLIIFAGSQVNLFYLREVLDFMSCC